MKAATHCAPLAGLPGDIVGSASKGASIEAGITTGLDVAGSVAGAVGGEAGASVAAAAASAVGISTAIGSAIPIPLLGSAIGAIVGAFTALGLWLKGATKDSFHPGAEAALNWLLLFQIAPGLIYGNVDEINTDVTNPPDKAARLVRYFRLISGIVPNRHNAPLYNPRDTSSKSNPYIESKTPDPGEPLTDTNVTARIGGLVQKYGGHPADPRIPSMLHTPVQAQHALRLLRGKQFARSGVTSWSILNPQTMADLRASVAKVRSLAGERGPDAYLARLLGGDVTPQPHTSYHHDVKIGESGAIEDTVRIVVEKNGGPSRFVWFGLGALTFATSLVGLAAWQIRKIDRKIEQKNKLTHKEH
jgi:hypothetical protein